MDDSDRACPECELTLVPAEGWTCSTCGGSIEIEVAVCPHCGTGIDWGTR